MARRRPRPEEPCVCGAYPTDDNWREHFNHWIEATAHRLVQQGFRPEEVGTAFHDAMNRILLIQHLQGTTT